MIAYGALFVCGILASLWFGVTVASGWMLFPVWMAAANPLTVTSAWLAGKKILPKKVTDYTEGAAFNIAYLIFFGLTTATLW